MKMLGDRLFNGKSWQLTRHTRANGTGYNQLTEMAGHRTDFPVVYDDGHVAYDRPESIPASVKKWVSSVLKRQSSRGRDRSRARRGPKDQGMRLARMIAKWSPAGRRMKPEEKLAWRESRLRRALERDGIPWRQAFHEIMVEQMIKEDHRSNHARYVRAYGSGRDRSRRRRSRSRW